MSRWEKFKKFLKNPGIWLLFFYAVFAAALAGSICLMALNMSENPLAYALYAISAILLGYCIYASVGPCRRLVYSVIHSNKLTERLVRDYGFRTAAFSGVSLAINAGYAVLQGVLGIIMHSYWYGLFAGYYIVLSVMRGVVLCLRPQGGQGARQTQNFSGVRRHADNFVCRIRLARRVSYNFGSAVQLRRIRRDNDGGIYVL